MPLSRICVPVPKIEDDAYDWWKRHESKKEWSRNHKAKVIFFGDSNTHFWSNEDGINYGEGVWDELFAGKDVLNMGYGFDRIQNTLWHIENGEVDGQEPDLAVLLMGANQLTVTENYSGDTPEETACGIKFLAEKLREKFPSAHIVVMELLPSGRRYDEKMEVNRILREIIPGMADTELIDASAGFFDADGNPDPQFFRKDMCHLCRKGYMLWYNAIKDILEKYI